MGMVMRDVAAEVPALKQQRVVVGDVLSGTVTPRIQHDGTICWDAALHPRNIGTCWMLHGHGETPVAAVADAIVQERRIQRERALEMAKIEREACVEGAGDDEVRDRLERIIGA